MRSSPTSSGPADGRAAAACNLFGFRLLERLVEDDPCRNAVVSPLSLALTLLMLQSGAAGETRRQIAAILEPAGADPDDVIRSGAALREALETPEPGTRLAVANGLWVDAGLRLSPAFQERVRTLHAARAETLNFADPHALEAVNLWISQATGGHIDSLLTDADLASPVSCVLASAAYFKGLWGTPFDPKLTQDAAFTLHDGSRKAVPLMSQSGQHDYLETGTFQAIRLPYGSGRLGMEVFLPVANMPLKRLLRDLGDERGERVPQFEEAQVELNLPRCKLACQAELSATLSALGMKKAFGPGADFSPMGLSGHYIGMVRHAVRAEIDEEGTEAAAATAAGLIRSLSRPVVMRVDRPFVCAIHDRPTGCLLFMAAVVSP